MRLLFHSNPVRAPHSHVVVPMFPPLQPSCGQWCSSDADGGLCPSKREARSATLTKSRNFGTKVRHIIMCVLYSMYTIKAIFGLCDVYIHVDVVCLILLWSSMMQSCLLQSQPGVDTLLWSPSQCLHHYSWYIHYMDIIHAFIRSSGMDLPTKVDEMHTLGCGANQSNVHAGIMT